MGFRTNARQGSGEIIGRGTQGITTLALAPGAVSTGTYLSSGVLGSIGGALGSTVSYAGGALSATLGTASNAILGTSATTSIASGLARAGSGISSAASALGLGSLATGAGTAITGALGVAGGVGLAVGGGYLAYKGTKLLGNYINKGRRELLDTLNPKITNINISNMKKNFFINNKKNQEAEDEKRKERKEKEKEKNNQNILDKQSKELSEQFQEKITNLQNAKKYIEKIEKRFETLVSNINTSSPNTEILKYSNINNPDFTITPARGSTVNIHLTKNGGKRTFRNKNDLDHNDYIICSFDSSGLLLGGKMTSEGLDIGGIKHNIDTTISSINNTIGELGKHPDKNIQKQLLTDGNNNISEIRKDLFSLGAIGKINEDHYNFDSTLDEQFGRSYKPVKYKAWSFQNIF